MTVARLKLTSLPSRSLTSFEAGIDDRKLTSLPSRSLTSFKAGIDDSDMLKLTTLPPRSLTSFKTGIDDSGTTEIDFTAIHSVIRWKDDRANGCSFDRGPGAEVVAST